MHKTNFRLQQPPSLLPLGLERGDPLELPRRRRPQVHTRRRPKQVLLRCPRPRPADIPLLRQEALLLTGRVAGAAREAVGVRALGFAVLGETPSTEHLQIFKSKACACEIIDCICH